jgi:hypothetical protein
MCGIKMKGVSKFLPYSHVCTCVYVYISEWMYAYFLREGEVVMYKDEGGESIHTGV